MTENNMATPCIQGERIAGMETNNSHIMKAVEEIKQDIKEIRALLISNNETFTKKKEFEEVKKEVEKQKLAWVWVTGFSAGLVFIAEKIFKMF
jgi:hypothetical protein